MAFVNVTLKTPGGQSYDVDVDEMASDQHLIESFAAELGLDRNNLSKYKLVLANGIKLKRGSILELIDVEAVGIGKRLTEVPPVLKRDDFSYPENTVLTVGNEVFIVHGHDEGARESVAHCIARLGFKPIILNEQASRGETIIEKIESYSNACFAVVVLTPDDVGAEKSQEGNLKFRARQNVIFELGYFIAKLGRKRVCALTKGQLEILSDFAGVIYEPIDSNGGWKMKMAKEMKAAGLDVDFNKLA